MLVLLPVLRDHGSNQFGESEAASSAAPSQSDVPIAINHGTTYSLRPKRCAVNNHLNISGAANKGRHATTRAPRLERLNGERAAVIT